MKQLDPNTGYLLRHTRVPAICALLMLVLLGGSYWLYGEQTHRLEQLSVNKDAMHSDYDALVFRRRLIDRYHHRYQQFYQQGFIGLENRLDWVETLRETIAC